MLSLTITFPLPYPYSNISVLPRTHASYQFSSFIIFIYLFMPCILFTYIAYTLHISTYTVYIYHNIILFLLNIYLIFSYTYTLQYDSYTMCIHMLFTYSYHIHQIPICIHILTHSYISYFPVYTYINHIFPFINAQHHYTIYFIITCTLALHGNIYILIRIHIFHIFISHIVHVHYLSYSLSCIHSINMLLFISLTFMHIHLVRLMYASHTYIFYLCITCICVSFL